MQCSLFNLASAQHSHLIFIILGTTNEARAAECKGCAVDRLWHCPPAAAASSSRCVLPAMGMARLTCASAATVLIPRLACLHRSFGELCS